MWISLSCQGVYLRCFTVIQQSFTSKIEADLMQHAASEYESKAKHTFISLIILKVGHSDLPACHS